MSVDMKVSVCVVAYNQELFIEQCLQSIIDQKTNFDFEILVADDCSTDRTPEIIARFMTRYPKHVKGFLHQKNIGPIPNFLFVHERAIGKYIAHIDGDDYMLPGKLQAQVDILDQNSDISFAAHAVQVIGSEQVIGNSSDYPNRGTLLDILRYRTYFVHSSVMVRREYDLLGAYDNDFFVDYNLYVERLAKGDVFLDKSILGAYRVHPQGISKSKKYSDNISAAYDRALTRALELGVPYNVVQSAKLQKKMQSAIAAYLSGDIRKYRAQIYIDKDNKNYASRKHKVLCYFRNFPWIISVYFWMRLWKK